MNAAGTAHPAPDTITGTLNSSAVIGAAAVAMQKNTDEIPSESRLSTVLCPSGLTTSTTDAVAMALSPLIPLIPTMSSELVENTESATYHKASRGGIGR